MKRESPVTIAARALSQARWAKMTSDERKKWAKWVASHRTREQMSQGGRPRSAGSRCSCGEMTVARAKARRHKCKAA
jgi:hypothetical protein